MKLHKILVKHWAPKGSYDGMAGYVIAENERAILDHLDSPDYSYTYGAWAEKEDNGDVYDITDEHYRVIGTETYLQRMLRLRGEYNDETSVDDAFYMVTHYGWDEGVEISEVDAVTLVRLGVAQDWAK